MKFVYYRILLLITTILFLESCGKLGVYEQTKTITKQEWSSKEKLSFILSLADSSSFYNTYVVLRHSDSYHYNNIWLELTTIPPNGASETEKINLKLADNKNGWSGAAFDDIIEQRILINKNPVQLKTGKYTFLLKQIMREDPLEFIHQAGIRLEKIN